MVPPYSSTSTRIICFIQFVTFAFCCDAAQQMEAKRHLTDLRSLHSKIEFTLHLISSRYWYSKDWVQRNKSTVFTVLIGRWQWGHPVMSCNTRAPLLTLLVYLLCEWTHLKKTDGMEMIKEPTVLSGLLMFGRLFPHCAIHFPLLCWSHNARERAVSIK